MLLALFAILAFASAQTSGPLQYQILPTYGNQTSNGSFTLRVYGIVYIYDSTNDAISDDTEFISDTAVRILEALADLNDQERQNLEDRLDPFRHWDLQDNIQTTFTIEENTSVTTSGETGITGLIDEFLSFDDDSLQTGDQIYQYSVGNFTGNFTIPTATGWSVISDIDDVLKNTEIWDPQRILETSFLEDFVVIPEMPQLFNQWNQNLPNSFFHYATTTPLPLARTFLTWLPANYPLGAFDFRPVDISNIDAVLNARTDQLNRIGQTFPDRKFIFVGDTSSADAVKAYAQYGRDHPTQLGCIFVRNVTATYPDFSNNNLNLQDELQGVPGAQWFVYDKPSDLYNVDPTSGNCHPPGIPANQNTISGGYGGTAGADNGGASFAPSTAVSILTLAILCFVALI